MDIGVRINAGWTLGLVLVLGLGLFPPSFLLGLVLVLGLELFLPSLPLGSVELEAWFVRVFSSEFTLDGASVADISTGIFPHQLASKRGVSMFLEAVRCGRLAVDVWVVLLDNELLSLALFLLLVIRGSALDIGYMKLDLTINNKTLKLQGPNNQKEGYTK